MKKILLILVVVVASVAVGYSATTVFFKSDSKVASLVEDKMLAAQVGIVSQQLEPCCKYEQDLVNRWESALRYSQSAEDSRTRVQSSKNPSTGSRAKDTTPTVQPDRSRVQRFFDSIMLKIRSSLPSKVASTESIDGSTQVAQPGGVIDAATYSRAQIQRYLQNARVRLADCLRTAPQKVAAGECREPEPSRAYPTDRNIPVPKKVIR